MTGGVVVDTSAAIAILTREAGAEWLGRTLISAAERHMSMATYLELAIVLEARLGPLAAGAGQRFVRDALIDLVDLDASVAERALEGWRRFGKGRHRAALTFGDCFTYGLGVHRGEPILCVGDDFAATDAAVLQPPDGVA